MLTVLFGTSCVGKTTLINNLQNKYSTKFVSCYTTRPSRLNDIGRYTINENDFAYLEKGGKFLIVNTNFNYKYGTPIDEINEAVNSQGNYIVDFLIKDLHSFDSFRCKKIIVIPENEKQLIEQITSANRLERKDEIISDYRENYNSDKIKEYINKGCLIYLNYFNNVDLNISQLFNLINGTNR